MEEPCLTERHSCPVCEASDVQEIHRRAYSDPEFSEFIELQYSRVGPGIDIELLSQSNYVLNRCRVCELIYQKYIPNDAMMALLYGKWIDPVTTRAAHMRNDGLDHFSGYASEISMLIDYIDKPVSTQRFLDFGMGWAKWCLMAKAFSVDSWGAELSEDRIAHALEMGIQISTWEDIPSMCFDVINTEQVFEHIAEPFQTIEHLKKGLSESGVIKVSVPGYIHSHEKLSNMRWQDGVPKGSREDLNPVFPLEHINCYSHRSLETLASKAGMRLITIPMQKQYRHTTNWCSVKKTIKNLALPIYRNVLKKQNYVFMTHK